MAPPDRCHPRSIHAREDFAFRGQQLRRGDRVLVVIAAADRDPAQFDRPDELDVTRQIKQHIAFGHGIHDCLGAPLARLEGQVAIGTLLRRMLDLRVTTDPSALRWRPGMLMRGLFELPIAS